MKRKWMALALILCLLLSGCGGGISKPEAASSEQQTQTEAEISAVVLDDELRFLLGEKRRKHPMF